VISTNGGMADIASVRGASTQTYAAPRSASIAIVASRAGPVTHERWRNSTATRTGANRLMIRAISARCASPQASDGGSCSRIASSLAPIGPNASRSVSIAASRNSRDGRTMCPRASAANGSVRSGPGRRDGSLRCPEITWWALTTNRNRSGVRSVQFSTVRSDGSA